jgi:hypothetical protein
LHHGHIPDDGSPITINIDAPTCWRFQIGIICWGFSNREAFSTMEPCNEAHGDFLLAETVNELFRRRNLQSIRTSESFVDQNI